MHPRVLKIIARLEAIALEATTLHKELHGIVFTEKSVGMEYGDFSMFKDTTRRLLEEFFHTPGNMLSHKAIRQNVMHDAEASESAVRNLVKRARKEMNDWCDCCYEIKTIVKRGYRLERTERIKNVSITAETPQKQGKHDTF